MPTDVRAMPNPTVYVGRDIVLQYGEGGDDIMWSDDDPVSQSRGGRDPSGGMHIPSKNDLPFLTQVKCPASSAWRPEGNQRAIVRIR